MANNRMTPRTFLAKQIRRLRGMSVDPETGREMTPADLAKLVYRSESLVKAWESGRRVPQHDDLRRLDEIFDTKGLLEEIGKELVKNERAPEWMDRWLEIEEKSDQLLTYQPLLIPGLLQTPEYACAVITKSGRKVDDVEKQVERRIDRQEVLSPYNDLMLVAIIDEGALYRPVGDQTTMHDQLVKLLEIAECPGVNVQVVPQNVGAYAGLAGGFVIASMEGHDFAYVDDVFSGDVLEHPEEVAIIKRIWEDLRLEALPGKQSIELIRKALDQWKT
ncbi:helix-turn-helix transcriptional regulator [Actinomadura meridiana]|uniref:Helix-turn-helix transcriptional regulator n=1 Tax=Actinomadura meridiana TaxID=559626 RepID=A0ABP8C715_9ACTN